MEETSARVLIAGGGTAGLEALLALHDVAAERLEMTLISPEPDFVYKPLLVEEPFQIGPAERHELEPVCRGLGARFVLGSLEQVRPADHRALLSDGSEHEYDFLLVCTGGHLRHSVEDAITFPGPHPLEIDGLIELAHGRESRTLAFVAPLRASWPLPIYELALLTERRSRELNLEIRIVVVTAERAPLVLFGESASAAVAALLGARGIEVQTNGPVRSYTGGELILVPSDHSVEADVVVALAEIVGSRVDGLPMDEQGFIPIDQHARVPGVNDVFAAGDGANFPVKQGGLAAQQADAAAEAISAAAGGRIREPSPFKPVLRGKLLTGDESLHMSHALAGGDGFGRVSSEALWWPPEKIAGKYLAAWLGHQVSGDLGRYGSSLDVEVALPKEWHEQPMTPGLV